MIDITEFASILVLKCKWYLSGNKTAHLSIYRKSQSGNFTRFNA